MYRMADKCKEFSKKQQEPKINDGEHKSSVTTDSTASTEVKTAINVDDKNAHNAKSMLSSVGAAEIESPNVALASRTTAHTPSNDTKTKTTPTTTAIATATAAIATSTPNNVISSKTVRNIFFLVYFGCLHLFETNSRKHLVVSLKTIAVDGNKKTKTTTRRKKSSMFSSFVKSKAKQRETGLC